MRRARRDRVVRSRQANARRAVAVRLARQRGPAMSRPRSPTNRSLLSPPGQEPGRPNIRLPVRWRRPEDDRYEQDPKWQQGVAQRAIQEPRIRRRIPSNGCDTSNQKITAGSSVQRWTLGDQEVAARGVMQAWPTLRQQWLR